MTLNYAYFDMKNELFTILIRLLIILPAIGLAFWKTKRIDLKKLGLLFILIMGSSLCLYIPSPTFLGNLYWNWWGKLMSIIFGLLFLFFQTKEDRAEYGFTTKLNPNTLKIIIITFIIMTLFLNGITYVINGFKGYNIEALLYQATMPGFEEELWFRGIYLGLLNNSFGKHWGSFWSKNRMGSDNRNNSFWIMSWYLI
jgi:uncharacterized protein